MADGLSATTDAQQNEQASTENDQFGESQRKENISNTDAPQDTTPTDLEKVACVFS